jgi:hypothetical protein
METKFKQSDFNNKFKQIGDIYHNSCIVDCTNSNNNRSGGLAMFWTADVKLDIISYNERIIDAYVDCDNNSLGWRASWIYGFSTHQQKPQTCDIIKNLFQNISHENWLLFGDFNMVLHHAEKQGGRDINSNLTFMFQDVFNLCNLQGLGYHGDFFTWTNNQETAHHIKERLDKLCVNPSVLTIISQITLLIIILFYLCLVLMMMLEMTLRTLMLLKDLIMFGSKTIKTSILLKKHGITLLMILTPSSSKPSTKCTNGAKTHMAIFLGRLNSFNKKFII